MGTLDPTATLKGNLESNEMILHKKNSTAEKVKKVAYKMIKRIFDIICALIGVILMLPIALIVKISYLRHGDRKSIFYKQKRIGKSEKVIHIYKFRSMVYNAEEILAEMLKEEKWKEELDKNQKFENDPRITKVGNFLRKTSLDEIPQFINVLISDMSLIGPRPLVKGELDAHDGSHEIYESVKPGITGWWACNGRSATDYAERLNLEYYYIKNQSLLLDIKCILATIKAVICKTGAK